MTHLSRLTEKEDAVEWLDSYGTFEFGKHEGEHIEDVAKDDSSYLRWVLDYADTLSKEDREVIEASLVFTSRRAR